MAARAEFNHVQVAPHHDGFIDAHLVTAPPAGRIVEPAALAKFGERIA